MLWVDFILAEFLVSCAGICTMLVRGVLGLHALVMLDSIGG